MEPTYIHSKGGYATLARIQHRAASIVSEFIHSSIKATSSNHGSKFTVCDYGAADGSTSREIIREGFYILQKNKNVKQLTWIMNDLPYNDFENCSWSSNEDWERNTFRLVCAKNFYQQVLPDESIDFGLCLDAVHWLSARIEKGNAFPIVSVEEVSQMNQVIARKAGANDWEQFLLCRGKELKQGGHMVITVAAISDMDSLLPHEILVSIVAPELLAEGRITKYEYQCITSVFAIERSEEDIRQPFLSSDSQVVKAGLHLNDIFPIKWKQNDHDQESKCTATNMISFLKSYGKTFLSVLSRTRSEEAAEEICELFYEKTAAHLHKHLGKYTMHGNYFVVEIMKDSM